MYYCVSFDSALLRTGIYPPVPSYLLLSIHQIPSASSVDRWQMTEMILLQIYVKNIPLVCVMNGTSTHEHLDELAVLGRVNLNPRDH